jgi:ElaB/YqjD/DUF883 family membrane-anchored ribosome-binding protein
VGQSPEELRRDIAQTREQLSGTLDAIGDRVSPGRIMERRKDRVLSRWASVKKGVMGSADDLRETTGQLTGNMTDRISGVGQGLSDVSDRARQLPATSRRKAQGNPLAAGVVAFGVGLLVAAFFPGTDTEAQLAEKVQDAAQPVLDQAKQAGQQVASNLQQPAEQALQQVQQTAQVGLNEVKDTAQQAATDTKETGTQAAGHVADRAQDAAQTVRQQP